MSNKLSEEEFKIIIDLAKVKGVEVCDTWIEKGISEYPFATHSKYKSKFKIVGGCTSSESISFNEIIKRLSEIGVPKKPTYPTIRLTEDYEAVVKDGFVEVGCQKIDFEKVRSLNSLIDGVEKKPVEKQCIEDYTLAKYSLDYFASYGNVRKLLDDEYSNYLKDFKEKSVEKLSFGDWFAKNYNVDYNDMCADLKIIVERTYQNYLLLKVL